MRLSLSRPAARGRGDSGAPLTPPPTSAVNQGGEGARGPGPGRPTIGAAGIAARMPGETTPPGTLSQAQRTRPRLRLSLAKKRPADMAGLAAPAAASDEKRRRLAPPKAEPAAPVSSSDGPPATPAPQPLPPILKAERRARARIDLALLDAEADHSWLAPVGAPLEQDAPPPEPRGGEASADDVDTTTSAEDTHRVDGEVLTPGVMRARLRKKRALGGDGRPRAEGGGELGAACAGLLAECSLEQRRDPVALSHQQHTWLAPTSGAKENTIASKRRRLTAIVMPPPAARSTTAPPDHHDTTMAAARTGQLSAAAAAETIRTEEALGASKLPLPVLTRGIVERAVLQGGQARADAAGEEALPSSILLGRPHLMADTNTHEHLPSAPGPAPRAADAKRAPIDATASIVTVHAARRVMEAVRPTPDASTLRMGARGPAARGGDAADVLAPLLARVLTTQRHWAPSGRASAPEPTMAAVRAPPAVCRQPRSGWATYSAHLAAELWSEASAQAGLPTPDALQSVLTA